MLVPSGVADNDAPADIMGDAATYGAGLPDSDEVADGSALPHADGVAELDKFVLDLTADFRTATLRLRIVALNTPASLASQE